MATKHGGPFIFSFMSNSSAWRYRTSRTTVSPRGEGATCNSTPYTGHQATTIVSQEKTQTMSMMVTTADVPPQTLPPVHTAHSRRRDRWPSFKQTEKLFLDIYIHHKWESRSRGPFLHTNTQVFRYTITAVLSKRCASHPVRPSIGPSIQEKKKNSRRIKSS